MTTRANIYVCEQFIAEIMSDAYPVRKDDPYYKGSLWGLLMSLDGCTEKKFREEIGKFQTDPDYLPPKSSGVGNWCYEYCWCPTKQPKIYRNWENWKGTILVRMPDFDITTEGYWQVPGEWIPIKSFVAFE